MTQATKKPRPFPSKKDILAFIDESPAPVDKREIARAFRISGADRVKLKAVLKDLKAEGLVEPGQRRRVGRKGSLPEVTVIEVAAVTGDGDVLAKPARWETDDAPPRIYLAPERRDAAGPGDRVLARLSRQPDGSSRLHLRQDQWAQRLRL